MDTRLTIKDMTRDELLQALSWQVEMGCDEALLETPVISESWQVSLADLRQQDEAKGPAPHPQSEPAPAPSVTAPSAPAPSGSVAFVIRSGPHCKNSGY